LLVHYICIITYVMYRRLTESFLRRNERSRKKTYSDTYSLKNLHRAMSLGIFLRPRDISSDGNYKQDRSHVLFSRSFFFCFCFPRPFKLVYEYETLTKTLFNTIRITIPHRVLDMFILRLIVPLGTLYEMYNHKTQAGNQQFA